MKLGSVQFYKFIILLSLALMILIPTTLSIYFAVKNHQLTVELIALQGFSADLEDQLPVTDTESETVPVGGVSFLDLGTEGSMSRNFPTTDNQAGTEGDFEYMQQFPGLYVNRGAGFEEPVQNSVYLTFDDGPSKTTSDILAILREKEVKATFFVVYSNKPEAAEILREIVADGHTIGVHTASHRYQEIYSSVEDYLTDFEKASSWIEAETGVKPNIFRFPGGSINVFNQLIYQPIIAEMLRRGYVYYDWNAASGDASKSATVLSITNNTINTLSAKSKAIVLMHDGSGNKNTPKALPEIIDTLKQSGRILLPLNNTVKPIAFSYQN